MTSIDGALIVDQNGKCYGFGMILDGSKTEKDKELVLVNKDRELLFQMGRVPQSVIARVGSRILERRALGQYVKGLSDVYAEAFADIQMVLLTGLTYKAYLEGFVNEENIDVDRWASQFEDSARISMVTFALRITGVWNTSDGEAALDEHSSETQKRLQQMIEEQIDLVKSSISYEEKEEINQYYGVARSFADTGDYKLDDIEELWREKGSLSSNNMQYYINEQLLLYLEECIKKSVDRYQDTDNRGKLRNTIKIISDFENVEDVFSTICNEIESYKKTVFGLSS